MGLKSSMASGMMRAALSCVRMAVLLATSRACGERWEREEGTAVGHTWREPHVMNRIKQADSPGVHTAKAGAVTSRFGWMWMCLCLDGVW